MFDKMFDRVSNRVQSFQSKLKKWAEDERYAIEDIEEVMDELNDAVEDEIEARIDELQHFVSTMPKQAQDRWIKLKAERDEKIADFKAKRQVKEVEQSQKKLDHSAEIAEVDATMAVFFSLMAFMEAEDAVLRAVEARATADAGVAT